MQKNWTNIRNGYLHHSGYYSSGGGGPVVVVAKYSFQHKIQPLLFDNHRSCSSITDDNTTTTEISGDSYDKQWITVTIVILFQTVFPLRFSLPMLISNVTYFGENNNNDDSSCQSLPNMPDSSTIVQNTKSLALQSNTILMTSLGGISSNISNVNKSTNESNINTGIMVDDEKLVKRIRFKGSLVNNEQQQQQQEHDDGQTNDNNQLIDQQNQSQSLSADHSGGGDPLEQNPFAYRPDTENIYSSRNSVANCYGYAWRRWSKTDAPSVKNQAAGTVQVPHTMPQIDDEDDRKFQYILGAPTSAGTRIGLMTMTYLNQGQSYEIRLKKLKKVSIEPNLKTSVRLGFVEKRLQYRENEELNGWVQSHNNGRMIDIDFSMSYGVFDVDLRSQFNHSMTFVWNPGREASIFIKINCISTEFTSKRHGGERGTPFRLIVDTYSLDGNKIDSACCLIKVFKSKGAERKHKTDRDRVSKHPDSENYYQPSYDSMVASCQQGGPGEFSMSTATLTISSPMMAGQNPQSQSSNNNKFVDKFDEPGIVRTSSLSLSIRSISPSITSMMKNFGSSSSLAPTLSNGLALDSGAIETYEWLKRNRFFRLAEQLCDYTAEDLRRLSRDDLIQLCDFKDGIRLYNLIHMPEISATKLTIFITFDGNEHYALYFKHLTMEEFREKLIECMYNNNIFGNFNTEQQQQQQSSEHHQQQHSIDSMILTRLRNIHMTGPNSIRIKLTNDVLQNMKNESIYRCLLNKVDNNEYDVIIIMIQSQNNQQQQQQQ
ncbi:hypothetical protein DERP_003639 [Dermatophagoides pteronyssinus]|uniref:Grh/CP2 DB domain-containing protein n=1 Tax=Dermatophagoides pteronyssinus TaxID=6956 RepID=A0ABQ8JLQ4_DERPT|nr:hypothetical protein DERP_003639 [Dermatophagoides pteronyssinus]